MREKHHYVLSCTLECLTMIYSMHKTWFIYDDFVEPPSWVYLMLHIQKKSNKKEEERARNDKKLQKCCNNAATDWCDCFTSFSITFTVAEKLQKCNKYGHQSIPTDRTTKNLNTCAQIVYIHLKWFNYFWKNCFKIPV